MRLLLVQHHDSITIKLTGRLTVTVCTTEMCSMDMRPPLAEQHTQALGMA
jgi:NADH:ubiquinone oxidoreductase subunit E